MPAKKEVTSIVTIKMFIARVVTTAPDGTGGAESTAYAYTADDRIVRPSQGPKGGLIPQTIPVDQEATLKKVYLERIARAESVEIPFKVRQTG